MDRKKRRGLSWALVIIAAIIIALGTGLALTASAQGWEGGRGGWARSGGPGPDFRDGRGFGRGPMFEGRMPLRAMAGLCLLGLAGLSGLGLGLVYVALRRGHGAGLHEGQHHGAIGLLRRDFAEGKISEDVYRSRLAVLRE